MPKKEKQIGALPWRRHAGVIEVLLITSRETKRWVIPKGWPMKDLIDSTAAKIEALEEAGVKGRVRRKPVGHFDYVKEHRDGDFPCRVTVYPLEVIELLDQWPEKSQRRRKWMSLEQAAAAVQERELQAMLLSFDIR